VYRHVVALSSAQHARLRVKPVADYGFARGLHMSALMQAEMVRASALYPIVFVEDREAEVFRPVALFGLQEGENAYVDLHGAWQASYIPAIVRGYPFSLVRAGRGDRHALCIDLGSPCVVEDEGAPLFDEAGRPMPALEEARAYFARLRQMQAVTDAYVRALAQRNLLTPFLVRARRGGVNVELDGCYVVNESRLDALPDDKLCPLRAHGWLAATYAHLASLLQMERLE
jgi:SapC